MRFKQSGIRLGKILLLLAMLLLCGLTVFGCIGGALPKGWSGGTIANDTLFLGSMDGRLIAINLSDNSSLWEVPLETPKPTGGGFSFSCAPASTSVAIYGSPAVDGDLVYIGGYNGKIYALSASSGTLRWVYPRQDSLQPIVSGPVVALGKVYIGCSDGILYALDATTGDKQWGFQTGDKIWSTPAIDGDTIYISSFDKKLYALNATNGNKKWEFEAEGAVASTPLIYNSTVYIGSFDRYLYAINADNGSLKWKFIAEKWFWARPVAYNNTIYAPCLDGKIYILDADSGHELVDAIDLGSPISSLPVLVDSSVIIAAEEGELYSIDTSNNQIKPLASLGGTVDAPLCARHGVVYVHTQKSESLYVLNAQTGVVLWRLPLTTK